MYVIEAQSHFPEVYGIHALFDLKGYGIGGEYYRWFITYLVGCKNIEFWNDAIFQPR